MDPTLIIIVKYFAEGAVFLQSARIICKGGIDLESTFSSGQAFRWRAAEDGFYGELEKTEVHVSVSDGEIIVTSAGDIRKVVDAANIYFDTERDYDAVKRKYDNERWVAEAFAAYPGLRVLRQPIFETIITFIISANNNTGRIAKIVRRLCENLGEKIGNNDVYSFPEAKKIAESSEEALRGMGMGYRAPYVRETARIIASGFPIQNLCEISYEEAHKRLLCLPGVGDKVADCVLLFSCGHLGAIPVDVWVERVLAEFFPDIKGRKKLKLAAMERFGELGGIAQQVLFHAARNGTIPIARV